MFTIHGTRSLRLTAAGAHSVVFICVYVCVLLVLLTAPPVRSCLIAGADTGSCTDPTDFDLLIPFCKSVVPYTACLPRYQSLWYNHSALAKDKFVEQMFTKIATQRKMYETNTTFLDKNTDEWGGSHEIVPRFVENPDCENAFRNYFCWMNFPRCDAEGRSLLLCRSVCENYMKACQLSKDLWRCGDPQYVNGREPETSVTWIVSSKASSSIASYYINTRTLIRTHRAPYQPLLPPLSLFFGRTRPSSTTARHSQDHHSRTTPSTPTRTSPSSSVPRASRTPLVATTMRRSDLSLPR